MCSERPPGEDVVFALLGENATSHQAGIGCPTYDRDPDDRRLDTCAQCSCNDERHHQVRKGKEYVGDTHRDFVDPSSEESTDQPKRDANTSSDDNHKGANSAASDPPGGRIGRYPASSEPDGMLYETAQGLVHGLLPAYTEGEVRTGFVQAQEEYLRRGITTIHDASVSNARGVDIMHTYHRAQQQGFLKFRVNMFIQWEFLKDSDFRLADRGR